MALRLLKVDEWKRVNTILLDAEVERIIPMFRRGEPFTIDMTVEGVNPKVEHAVFSYLCEIHIPENVGATGVFIGKVEVEELRRLAKAIVEGAGT